MSISDARSALAAYAKAVRDARKANPRASDEGSGLELLLAPHFHSVLQQLLALVGGVAPPTVLAEYIKPGVGRPDLALARPASPARSFVELKAPDKRLARLSGHDRAQFERFKALPLWALTNFHQLHLYERGERRAEVIVVPEAALEAETSDIQAARLLSRHDPAPLLEIVALLAAAQPPVMATAREVAEVLAYAARLVRGIVLDACREGADEVMGAVQAEFRETLFAHPAAGGYDETDEQKLFANAFAQTLAFGLLLARDATGAECDTQAYRHLPEGTYPLLRATLRALTQDEIVTTLGAGFDVLRDTVNAIDLSLLAKRGDHDPIIYFYEEFLAVFDAAARRRHGVYFTPVQVVRFMVAATDWALRHHLGTDGLLDEERQVLLLDPACGTGTFLLAAASFAAERAARERGEGAVPGVMTRLAERLFGFELLVGPYTIAHFRLHRELVAAGAKLNQRLNIFLADTLAPPGGAKEAVSHLGFMSKPIVAERAGADHVKGKVPILAIIGNPPYRRLAAGEEDAITRPWANGFWDDLKQPVRDAGWGNDLNTFPDLYIAFWRWALWKLFESEGAPGRGVVCFICNRTFLSGHPYAGLRKMLRERFDSIDVIDLRGDSRGERPAGMQDDENVFAIQAGVCIVLAVATGAKGVADG